MSLKPRVKAGTSKSAVAQRRKAFAKAYVANGRNGTQAAITAGFSKNGADVVAARLLGDARVSALIEELTEKHSAAADLTIERTLREVARLAYFDPRKLYDDEGNMKQPHEWDDATAAAIGSIEVLEEFEGSGEDRRMSGYTKKVKPWDKNAALEKAMKHLGLYEKDNAQQAESLTLRIVAATPVKR